MVENNNINNNGLRAQQYRASLMRPRRFGGCNFNFNVIVLISAIVLITSASLVVCGTVPNRAPAPVNPNILQTSIKKPAGRIMHPAFENAGKVKGLEIWRIEDFEPVIYPKKDYGKFYTGDSYIVLNTKENKKKELSWDVHFWLGLETSTDEAGAAAILTVQLDDLLNGGPIQHREVQDHESELFLSYFKNGVRYEAGGVASGFHKVETNAAGEKRLFQVKGKKNIRVRQVGLSIASMNNGDCFILDAGNEIFVYVGKNAKRVEKIKAISAANQIRDQDHHGRATVQIVDEFSSVVDQEEFFQKLGSGSPDTVPEEAVGGDDATFETADAAAVTLYKVSDSDGSLKIDPISTKPLRQDMLKTDDCFILDTGSGIYAWIGKRATQQEKSKALERAQNFIQTKKYPSWTSVQRIIEGAETAPFKQYFATWRDPGMTHSRLIRAANDEDSDNAEEEEIDPAIFNALKKSGGRALDFMPDNGDGDVQVWRIENFELIDVDPEMYGMFFGGDSYVIKYHYNNKRGGQGYVLYYWLGKHSSIDEKAAAALQTVNLDNELDGAAIQVRVVQGHEPRHFLKIFKGKMIIFRGGHASGFNNINDNDTYETEGIRLFRVSGTSADDVRAVQLPLVASSLASDDVFILELAGETIIWQGNGGSEFEKEMAAEIVPRLTGPSSEVKVVDEGSEPEEFWTALGGEGDYDKELDRPGAPILDARLFHCRIRANGRLRVEEIHHFEQEDLDTDDIMIVDGGDEIYVWEGVGASDEEKLRALDMAKLYINRDPSERNEETVPIVKVHQGHEPRSFKRLFPAWDDEMWEHLPTYEEIKQKVREANNLITLTD